MVSADHGLLLATGGDDGCVKIWKMADILEAAAAAAAAAPPAAAAAVNGSDSQSSAARMQPAAAVQLPHVQNLLGVSEGSQPAAQALAADHQRQRLYIGEMDQSLDHICQSLVSVQSAQQLPSHHRQDYCTGVFQCSRRSSTF